jgi:hypothetical protein
VQAAAEVDAGDRGRPLVGYESAYWIGIRMSVTPSWAEHGAVHELDHRVHDGLRVHEHLDAVRVHPEEPARLDDLEPLVHEGRGVDRDLAAHVPGRVLQGLAGVTSRKLSRGRLRNGPPMR